MKSSSNLFPVSLIRAELIAEQFIEDTYLLKPNNSSDRSVQIAVTRLGFYKNETKKKGKPVILIHGSFTNRGFWFSQKGKGLARALLESGLDPWMLELRGHGDSPENIEYNQNSIDIYAGYDIPAVIDFIQEQTMQKPVWIGHSMGGVIVSTALAKGCITPDNSEAVVMLGSQVSRFPFLLRLPVFRLLARIILSLRKPLIKSKLGPEHEPLGIAKEFIRWAGLFHGWKSPKGQKYWHELKKIQIPVLAFGAKKDKGDPVKYCNKLALSIDDNATCIELSKQKGFKCDYNHTNMVISEDAKSEVWPKIINWINLTEKGQSND